MEMNGKAMANNLSRRANLLRGLRRKGISCNTRLRTIYIPYGTDPHDYPQAMKLAREFHFGIQFVIV